MKHGQKMKAVYSSTLHISVESFTKISLNTYICYRTFCQPYKLMTERR